MYLYVCIFLFTYYPTYPPIHLSILHCLSILSISLRVYLHIFLLTYISTYTFIYFALFIYLYISTCLLSYLFINLHIYLSICLKPDSQCIFLSVHAFFLPSILPDAASPSASRLRSGEIYDKLLPELE